jgi:hypothetical protein
MKLIGVGKKSCWYHNTTKGTMETLSPGQIFELDIKEDAEQIFQLISGLRAAPADDSLVPERASYKVLVGFYRKGEDGRMIEAKRGQMLTLDRIQAVEFMIRGYVVPSDPDAWQPRDLINPRGPVDTVVKNMFDSPEPERENWAQKGVVRK